MRAAQRERLLSARRLLLRWHTHQNQRSFSWRHTVRDPYHVWICEMMGQQTQASRIEEYLGRFLSRFPTVTALASSPQRDVVRAWQGLGYNRRAVYLHRAAQEIVERYDGALPSSDSELRSLPGIGDYTARAIQVFAFNSPVSAVDVNVSRVLTRLSKRVRDRAVLLPILTVHAVNEAILPRKRNREWHEALMDLGATVCTKNRPACDRCPLRSVCPSDGLANAQKQRGPAKSEPLYVGHPKRIWRGRVLKLIAASPMRRQSLRVAVAEAHSLDISQADQILTLVLPPLIDEGFVHLHRGRYELR